MISARGNAEVWLFTGGILLGSLVMGFYARDVSSSASFFLSIVLGIWLMTTIAAVAHSVMREKKP